MSAEANQQRPLIIFNDRDGTTHWGPPPFATLRRLFFKKLEIPPVGTKLEPAKPKNALLNALNVAWHYHRRIKPDAEKGLDLLKKVAEIEFEERKITLAVLSGRDPGLHNITTRSIESSGHLRFFDPGHIFLNTSHSSAGFKEDIGMKAVLRGSNIVLFEDDIVAAIRFSRVQKFCEPDQKVLVYLLRNISNHPWLLTRAGVLVPNNVTLVDNYLEGALDLSSKVRNELI